MRNSIVKILTWVGIALFAWTAALFLAFNTQAEEFDNQVMDIPVKCEYRRSKVREIETQYADRIYAIWVRSGDETDPKLLHNKALYTASYILLDNGITCRRNKTTVNN